LAKGWMPAHPTLFLKREVYEKYGEFDLSFKIAADYDFMLRVLKSGIKVKYLPKVLYKMRVGGESNKSIKNIVRKSREDLKALKKNSVGGFGSLIVKNLSKIGQFLRKS
jgi:glycosyltransferase